VDRSRLQEDLLHLIQDQQPIITRLQGYYGILSSSNLGGTAKLFSETSAFLGQYGSHGN
jgi:hypothetical protein